MESYERHRKEWEQYIKDEAKRAFSSTWMEKDTLDYWRHSRMLGPVSALVGTGEKWLTIGDGRYGTDANFLMSIGGDAHASDISDQLLEVAHEKGFIKEFSEQNAEYLKFADSSFDYVLIKEAFHHFPRPWIALYEAFRVARKGVVLIEPSDDDSHLKIPVIGALNVIYINVRDLLKKLLGKASSSYWFEPVGNFGYTVNLKELEKFLLGMNYTYIASTGLNDYYEYGIEYVKVASQKKEDVVRKKRVIRSIRMLDLLCRIGIRSYNMQATCLFKRAPTSEIQASLYKSGWKVVKLPENPYI